ncbi:MAG: helix-turn-helix domain-containing protein [Nanoarchaeota archaeon]
MEKELQELGLTENESKIYIFLLKQGECTTGPIIKETNIANSRVYESLNSLISKGFVTYNLQKKGKYFQAVSPSILKEKEEERKSKISSLIPSLINLQNLSKEETKTAIYEGYEGFKTAFKKIIDDCQKNETIQILGFSEQQYASKTLRTFIANMNLKSAKKKQKLKVILDQNVKETQGKERKQEKYTEVRYMPKGYISPIAVDIFQDYVYMFLWEEKPYVFMIKNKSIAKSFKVYFEFLWKLANHKT